MERTFTDALKEGIIVLQYFYEIVFVFALCVLFGGVRVNASGLTFSSLKEGEGRKISNADDDEYMKVNDTMTMARKR